jgi:hypothetical protein
VVDAVRGDGGAHRRRLYTLPPPTGR